ncbi:hypothetical protein CYLTODRAFT_225842 [Cylindrobasidium torrendii FP15055 ss-10]|uniref:Uncharacterized protein n=1 Tax=Cylindrobasidium torrendii FP15055 ss-10 TaxID=1314674 RepID=A0A0D7AVW3_9AGAR|nr:hypothetical protein CYLTODRAFT_225842 [Cylindrobasidium torrendii FP15055 ss-10]
MDRCGRDRRSCDAWAGMGGFALRDVFCNVASVTLVTKQPWERGIGLNTEVKDRTGVASRTGMFVRWAENGKRTSLNITFDPAHPVVRLSSYSPLVFAIPPQRLERRRGARRERRIRQRESLGRFRGGWLTCGWACLARRSLWCSVSYVGY